MRLTRPPISTLVRTLPVDHHTIRVSRKVWKDRFRNARLAVELEAIFGDSEEIGLSRQSIRQQADARRKCLEVLLWGYPSGMRGNETAYLANLDEISRGASSDAPWPEYFEALDAVRGLGMSTVTKLAYFFGKTFDGHPAVILDNRITKLLSRGIWAELGELRHVTNNNAPRNYLRYLETIASVSQGIEGATSEQLEFFLFSLGDAFGASLCEVGESPKR
jgi:hypothetical protein